VSWTPTATDTGSTGGTSTGDDSVEAVSCGSATVESTVGCSFTDTSMEAGRTAPAPGPTPARRKMLMCLTEPAVTAWVTPPPQQPVETRQFIGGGILPVRPGQASRLRRHPVPALPGRARLARPVDRRADRCHPACRRTPRPGRRLDPPLLSVLDEAANICRIRRLPSPYFYYCSHGLPIITILQSYAQGVDVWGREGMRKLWSAANVRTYGGGVADPEFLDELAKLIGEHDVITRSASTSGAGWGDRSVSHAPRRQRILDVSDLGALPRGRMVVFASGAPPVLGRTLPLQDGPHAQEIRDLIAFWDPDQRGDWALDPAAGPSSDPARVGRRRRRSPEHSARPTHRHTRAARRRRQPKKRSWCTATSRSSSTSTSFTSWNGDLPPVQSPACSGAPAGGPTPKHSAASTPCGAPRKHYGSATPPSA
jgi:hypothetical protein